MTQKKEFVIGVTGGTASGQTSDCREFFKLFSGLSLLLLAQDAYYKKSEQPFTERKKIHYDHPLAFDTPSRLQLLETHLLRHAVELPVYD